MTELLAEREKKIRDLEVDLQFIKSTEQVMEKQVELANKSTKERDDELRMSISTNRNLEDENKRKEKELEKREKKVDELERRLANMEFDKELE